MCGGTLINFKYGISALHCFAQEDKQIYFDYENSVVTAGALMSEKDANVQKVKISRVLHKLIVYIFSDCCSCQLLVA